MPKITFITAAGESIIAEGSSGSVMDLAKQYNVTGIDGDCGGVCSCATCHVHVTPADFDTTGAPSEIEADMLELDDNGSHNGIINSPASLFINIDSDNGATGEDFVIAKDRTPPLARSLAQPCERAQ